MTTITAEPAPVVRRFATALLSLDEAALTDNSTFDLSWTIPGHGLVSGVHLGVPAVMAVARAISEHGVVVEVEQILAGRNGVTALLHESGDRFGKQLDVRVALSVLTRNDRVATITGYISDPDAYDHFLDDTPRAPARLRAALLRRPRFDQAGALAATRLRTSDGR
jgi:ketosteroid isomerase-like protein